MIKTKEEFIATLNRITDGNNSDDVLDTIQYATALETNDDKIIELQQKIQELEQEKTEMDNAWREKYRNAFFNPPNKDDQIDDDTKGNENKSWGTNTIKDLFHPKN